MSLTAIPVANSGVFSVERIGKGIFVQSEASPPSSTIFFLISGL